MVEEELPDYARNDTSRGVATVVHQHDESRRLKVVWGLCGVQQLLVRLFMLSGLLRVWLR